VQLFFKFKSYMITVHQRHRHTDRRTNRRTDDLPKHNCALQSIVRKKISVMSTNCAMLHNCRLVSGRQCIFPWV